MSGTAGSRPEAGRTATNREMEKEFAFFGEVWTFFKKYYFPRPDASYWSDLVEEDKSTIKLGKNTMSLLRKCAYNIARLLQMENLKGQRGIPDIIDDVCDNLEIGFQMIFSPIPSRY